MGNTLAEIHKLSHLTLNLAGNEFDEETGKMVQNHIKNSLMDCEVNFGEKKVWAW